MPKLSVPALVDLQAERIKALEETQARLVQQCEELTAARDRALAQVQALLDRRPATTREALPEPAPRRREFDLDTLDPEETLPAGLRVEDLLSGLKA